MPYKNLLLAVAVLILACACVFEDKSPLADQIKKYSIDELQYLSIDSIHDHKELSKIINTLKESKVDSTLLKAIWKKSDLFSSQNNSDSVLKYDRLLLKKAMNQKNILYTAKGESYLAYDFRERQQFDSAFYYYQRAKNSYLKLSDSTQTGKKLLDIGKIQYRQNDFYGSKESLTEALRYLHKKRDKKYVIWCWNELGNNFSSLNDFSNAKYYYEKAIQEEIDIVNKVLYVNNLAILYSKQGDYEKASELLEDALQSIPNDFNPSEYARLIHNKAENQWRLTNADILDTYYEAVKIRKNVGDKRGLLSSFTGLSEYFEKINPTISKKYADSLISVSKELKIPKAEIDALQILFRIKPENIAYKNRYIFLQDSLYLQELKVKNQFAYLKYQDQEEKNRLLELETATAKQETELAQEETQKILFLSTSTIFLLGGISLFFLLKQRHKKEKLKEIYTTEKRISQRLHDGLANDIFSLMARVENKEKVQNTEVLDHLESIYSKTRDISHENSPVKINEHFLEELETLIQSFYSKDTTIVTKGLNNIKWEKLSEAKCVALHRCIKELLVNMKKHSQASLVGLQFSLDQKNICVDYKDNGSGFPTKIIYGMGLQNAENRIQSCGGTFTFIPKQGNGAEIRVTIPHKFKA